MTRTQKIVSVGLASAAGFAVLFMSDNGRMTTGSWVTTARAVIGRPLTPLSYAGVARRTTRRAVAAGAAVGAARAAPVYVAPTCVQVVDVYGRIYYRCP